MDCDTFSEPQTESPVPHVLTQFDAAPTFRERVAALHETTKPRITRLVLITAGVGFVLAAAGRSWTLGQLVATILGCLVGTFLSSSGANALNEWMERDRDARMPRTATRPLPQGRLMPMQVLLAGLVLSIVGVGVLWLTTGPIAAAVSASIILMYLLIYTPLKPVTPLATIIGAVPGALPPMIGWAAASGDVGIRSLEQPGGWLLFLIMFVWQIPHFLAIAWLYRDDYSLGGFKVLPVIDPRCIRTTWAILVWSVCLIPVTLAPAIFVGDRLGMIYLVVAAVTGAGFLWVAVQLARGRTRAGARRLFIASIIHLPILFAAIVADTLVSVLG